MSNPRWTEAERDYLLLWWPQVEQIAQHTGRPESAVIVKASKLRREGAILRPRNRGRVWIDLEDRKKEDGMDLLEQLAARGIYFALYHTKLLGWHAQIWKDKDWWELGTAPTAQECLDAVSKWADKQKESSSESRA